jgi:hypothetical protein
MAATHCGRIEDDETIWNASSDVRPPKKGLFVGCGELGGALKAALKSAGDQRRKWTLYLHAYNLDKVSRLDGGCTCASRSRLNRFERSKQANPKSRRHPPETRNIHVVRVFRAAKVPDQSCTVESMWPPQHPLVHFPTYTLSTPCKNVKQLVYNSVGKKRRCDLISTPRLGALAVAYSSSINTIEGAATETIPGSLLQDALGCALGWHSTHKRKTTFASAAGRPQSQL